MKSSMLYSFYELYSGMSQSRYDDVLGYLTMHDVFVGYTPEYVDSIDMGDGFSYKAIIRVKCDKDGRLYAHINRMTCTPIRESAEAMFRITDTQIDDEYFDR